VARVAILRAPTDLGIADAVRETLAWARAEYVVLLSNDTAVSPG
jgi:hypothetical protein